MLLTNHFQTELALHTHVAVSDIRHDVASTREIVSDIRTIVKDQGVRNQTASDHYDLFLPANPYNCLDPGPYV